MAPEPAFRTATLRAQDGFSDEEMEEVRIAFHAQRLDTEGSTISSAPRAKEEAEIATPAIQRHGLPELESGLEELPRGPTELFPCLGVPCDTWATSTALISPSSW